MDGLRPPQMLCLDSSNLSKTWKSWRDEFELYIGLTVAEDDEKKKVRLFSYLVSESGRELLDTLMGDTRDGTKYSLTKYRDTKLDETHRGRKKWIAK